METLQEKQEAEDCGHSERRGEEPRRLAQWIDKKDRDEDGDGSRKRDCVVGTYAYETGDLKLSEHKTYKGKCTVESNEGPKPSKLTPPDEIPLRLRTPK